jgi:4-hydroxythreonine-4-phosphate dehydrogenase
MTPRLAITAGEPAGIGPDLVVALAERAFDAELVVLGDPALFASRALSLGREFASTAFDPRAPARPHRGGALPVLPIALDAEVVAGQLDVRNASHVLSILAQASAGALDGRFDAIVTAPVQKSVLSDAGVMFRGHTEFFAERAGCDVVMLLIGGGIRVALATTHLPLAAVPAALDRAGLTRTLAILHAGLRRDFGLAEPRIAVLGLNPHAGERGHLGREEIDIIAPALDALRERGLDLVGPLPADTAFSPHLRGEFHAYLAMYHDQGLPVLKALGFGEGINVTLGLPYIRTSVDHGTALDLAGTGRADARSFFAAIECAIDLVARRGRTR